MNDMNTVIVYCWNPTSEIRTYKVTDEKEFYRVKELTREDENYGYIGEIDLHYEYSKFTVIRIFNHILETIMCPFVLMFSGTSCNRYEIHIELRSSIFVDSYILNLNDRFYKMMESFFEDCEFKITDYNNTRNVFWFTKKEV